MADVLLLEFPGVTADEYRSVNERLGVNTTSGEGDWPPGLHSHVAATNGEGLVVVEIWESQAVQEAFMGRLGSALAAVGMPEPSRMVWLEQAGHYHA